MAQIGDLATKSGTIAPDQTGTANPEVLGNPVAGPFTVQLGPSIVTYGVEHAFGHYWVSASQPAANVHAIWKFDENGRFIKSFDQAPQTGTVNVGYRDGASNESQNQLYFIWGERNFAIHEYDPATGDLVLECAHILRNGSGQATRAFARTPGSTFVTQQADGRMIEFESSRGRIITSRDQAGISASGCAYDAASDTFWWSTDDGSIIETTRGFDLTGRRIDGTTGFTAFTRGGGLDIYADARSPSGDAFAMLGQGTPDEIAVYEAPARASTPVPTRAIFCGACAGCACNYNTMTGFNVCDVHDFLDFASEFAGGFSCAVDFDVSTGLGIADIFDFMAFQQDFFFGPCP